MSDIALQAMASPTHLACVRGVDAGLVFPLPSSVGRGRDHFIVDQQISRDHANIIRAKKGFRLYDTGSTNGTLLTLGLLHRRVKGKPRTFRRRMALRLGRDTFILRGRPRKYAWRESRKLSMRAFLAFFPFITMALFLGVRLGSFRYVTYGLGVLAVGLVLVTLGIRLRRNKQRVRLDPAGLAIMLAFLQAQGQSARGGHTARQRSHPDRWQRRTNRTPQDTYPINQRLRVSFPGSHRRLTLQLDSPCAIACIGDDARATASWIAGNIIAVSRGGYVITETSEEYAFGNAGPTIHIMRGHQCPHCMASLNTAPVSLTDRERNDTPWHVAIGMGLEDVPPWCTLNVEKRMSCAPRWWEQFEPVSTGSSLPTSVDLCSLLAHTTGNSSHDGTHLSVPIGVNDAGPLTIDLVNDGPHALLAGTTGSGKSEALITWIQALISTYTPAEIRMILIDYKGGATFHRFESAPHVDRVFTDLNPAQTRRALRGLTSLLLRREQEFSRLGFPDYATWARAHRDGAATCPPPRIIVVIDEFRVLVDAHKGGSDIINRLAAQGRSLGVHLIIATQRPSGAVSSAMRANIDIRIALRCLSDSDSIDVIGDAKAAHLERIPGRAMWADRGLFQCAWSPNSTTDVQRPDPHCAPQGCGTSTPHTTSQNEHWEPLAWAPFLPPSITWKELDLLSKESPHVAGVPLGLGDGVDSGAYTPVRWRSGNILVRAPAHHTIETASLVRQIATRISTRSSWEIDLIDAQATPSSDTRGLTIREGQDIATLFEQAQRHAPRIIAITDIAASRHELERTYGLVVAEEIWTNGIEECIQRGVVFIMGSLGPHPLTRFDRSLASLLIERPDMSEPHYRASSATEEPCESGQWWVEADHQRTLALFPSTDLAKKNRGAEATLVAPTKDCYGDFKHPDSAQLLVGPGWEGFNIYVRKHLFTAQTQPEQDKELSDWIIMHNESQVIQTILRRNLASLGIKNPQIETLSPTQWPHLPIQKQTNLLIIDPPPDFIRSFKHSTNRLQTSLFARRWKENTGIIRVAGHFDRVALSCSGHRRDNLHTEF